jgi:NitT/TauT family transport system permease protein
MKRVIITVIFFALLILVWAALTGDLAAFGLDISLWSPYVLPPPSTVGHYLWDNTVNGKIPLSMLITLRRLLIGYVIGLILGVPLGMLAARFRSVNDTLGMLALGLQALPSVCWVPLACIWFGQTESALLFVVIMGTLWSVLLSTQNGMKNVPPIYARAARTMGSSPLHTLVFVTLPASAPFVVSGMKQGWAFAWRSLMAAEIYVSVVSGFGIGQYLHYGRELQRMYQVIGIMFIIIVVGLLADKILFSPVESWLHRRWGTNKD